MKELTKTTRLGDLLLQFGVIGTAQLAEVTTQAAKMGIPLGKTLVLSGLMTMTELENVLKMQSMVRSGQLSIDIAADAFRICRTEGRSLGDALNKAGYERKLQSSSRLGTLLVESEIITQAQLDETQEMSYETGIPLGRMLCLNGIISEQRLALALELQRRLRDHEITHEEAVDILANRKSKNAALVDTPKLAVEKMDSNERKSLKKVKLGEMLLLSGLITELDVMNALEHSLTQSKPMGEVLAEHGLVDQSLIELAAELQESVNSGDLPIAAAADTLNYVAKTGTKPKAAEEATPDAAPDTIRLGELLQMSEYVSAKDIDYAREILTLFPSLLGKLLVVAGAIDEPTLLSALRAQFFLRHNHVSLDDAIRALKFSGDHRVSFDDALESLNIQNPGG
ncbi:MAG: hypothetical protein K2Y39_23635 [Candidatus Obscuribacterales bacterium]|nr:hypothetical protein [Candidatus Obscuribacterales bacterium]